MLIDCLDPSCDGAVINASSGAECEHTTEVSCDDGADNDGDGSADCLDSDCANDPACSSSSSENCLTLGDEDGDGLADCLDTDCNGSPGYDAFGNLGLCQYAAELSCNDSMDNDGDLLIDCNDPNCAADSNCLSTTTETNCVNGVDDDGDGDTDCDDSDCASLQTVSPLVLKTASPQQMMMVMDWRTAWIVIVMDLLAMTPSTILASVSLVQRRIVQTVWTMMATVTLIVRTSTVQMILLVNLQLVKTA